jgi:hypothetical protein
LQQDLKTNEIMKKILSLIIASLLLLSISIIMPELNAEIANAQTGLKETFYCLEDDEEFCFGYFLNDKMIVHKGILTKQVEDPDDDPHL